MRDVNTRGIYSTVSLSILCKALRRKNLPRNIAIQESSYSWHLFPVLTGPESSVLIDAFF